MGNKSSKGVPKGPAASTHDVLVIGGGVAGLSTLRALRKAGYNAALVTDGPLGEGQTAKCHKWVHWGYGIAALGLLDAAKAMWTLKAKDSVLKGTGWETVYSVPRAMFDNNFLPVMKELDMPYELIDDKCSDTRVTFKAKDEMFDVDEWMTALASGNEDFIGCSAQDSHDNRVVRLDRLPDGTFQVKLAGKRVGLIQAKAVVVAAGTGIKQVLNSGNLEIPDDVIADKLHAVRRVHMVNIKGPSSLLGKTSVLAIRPGYAPTMMAAVPDGDNTVFLTTPFPGPCKPDDPPHRQHTSEEWGPHANWAEGVKPDPEYCRHAINAAIAEMPQLEQGFKDGTVQIGIYGGQKQDGNKSYGAPTIETVDGIENLIVTNAQVVCFSDAVGERITAKIQENGVKPTGADAPKPAWANGAGKMNIAVPEHKKATTVFMGFEEFMAKYDVPALVPDVPKEKSHHSATHG